MDCERLDPLVTPYVDDQLPDADRAIVDQHLRRCPPCHSRVAAERAVRTLIHTRRHALGAPCAPDALHARCSQYARGADVRMDAAPPPRAGVWGPRLAPVALAASLVLVVGGAFVFQLTESSSRVLAAELTADHVRCFALAGLHTNVTPAAVESALVTGFGWRAHLPEETSQAGLELIGARPCLYAEGKVAHIMYRHNGEPVSVFMLPKTARSNDVVRVLGHEATIWCDGERTFVLIAREPRPEVDRIASFVRASLH